MAVDTVAAAPYSRPPYTKAIRDLAFFALKESRAFPSPAPSGPEQQAASVMQRPPLRNHGTRANGIERRLAQTTGVCAVLALALLAAGPAPAVSEGEIAPEFSLPTLGGGPARSLAESHGKVRYLDFWASWCAPCRVSIPAMVDLQAELGGEDFEILAINVDKRPEDALRFLERYPINYVNLSDPQGAVAAAYALPGMPTSFVVDRDGHITLMHAGFRRGDMEAIRAHILELLDLHLTGGS